MPEKKRKRNDADNESQSKKKTVQHAATAIKFRLLDDIGSWQPVIASSPGLEAPSGLSLDVYKKSTSDRGAEELLLHTANAHAKLDYTAREEKSGEAVDLMKHYVGVFDSVSGDLQLVPAQRMVVRGTLRSATTLEEDIEEVMPQNTYGGRQLLGEAFGTKKSQKAIRALTENAIASPAHKRNASGKPVLDASASAILGSLADSSSAMPTKEQLQASMDEAKPRPKANLETEKAEEVYPIEVLVGKNILFDLDHKPWTEAISKSKDVPTVSQFVSRNLVRIVKTKDTKKIKTLKFLLTLIQWYKGLKSVGKDGKKLPTKEEQAAAMPDAEPKVLESVKRKFAPNQRLNRWDIDYLVSHICALSIVLEPSLETDMYYLASDLGLEIKQLSQYFHEIGCRVAPLTEADRKKLDLTKAAAAAHRIAKLRMPLEFPKIRKPISKRR